MSEMKYCGNCRYKDTGYKGCNFCISNAARPDLKPTHWESKEDESEPDICKACKHYYDPEKEPCKSCDELDAQMTKVENVVNHPSHYQTKSGLETIQVIEAFTEGLEGIYAVDTANVIKYICRWKKKNGLQDLKKAQWYLNNLIDHVEQINEENNKYWAKIEKEEKENK